MTIDETWAVRVAEWKASGLTSAAYCEGKPFSPGGLRHWAYRLGKARTRRSEVPAIPLGRVVRQVLPGPPPDQKTPVAGLDRASAETLAIECGPMRILIRPGFDRQTLVAVLDVLSARGGSR